MLDINIDRLDRGEAYKNAKASFEVLNSKFETYELVNTVPAFFIGRNISLIFLLKIPLDQFFELMQMNTFQT